jgi:hypothetical protein
MKVVCIFNPHKVWNITVGKTYDVYCKTIYHYDIEYIIDDNGEEFEGSFIFGSGFSIFTDGYFLPLEEWREQKINEIGIE